MASWSHEPRRGRPDWAYALLFALVIAAAFAIAGTVESKSLNPATDCQWGEIRTAEGECR